MITGDAEQHVYSKLGERLGLADHQAVLTSLHPKPYFIRSRETHCFCMQTHAHCPLLLLLLCVCVFQLQLMQSSNV
jgi:hypothetical protein